MHSQRQSMGTQQSAHVRQLHTAFVPTPPQKVLCMRVVSITIGAGQPARY